MNRKIAILLLLMCVFLSKIAMIGKVKHSSAADLQPDQRAPLPIAITKANLVRSEAPLVLFVSGDGGWNSFDQHICDQLAAKGISSIGLDAKKYFWKKRTPEETAKDIAYLLETYSMAWKKEKLVLMGYSMGAEILPFVYELLPENLKAKLKGLMLLSPAEKGDFEIHPSNRLGWGSKQNKYDVLKALKRLPATLPIQIILGREEGSIFPQSLSGANIHFALIPGDHHYQKNISLVVDTMINSQLF